MPNPNNITCPILIVGAGRTGSSYLLKILQDRGDVQSLIENHIVMQLRELVYNSWWSDNWNYVYTSVELEAKFVELARSTMVLLFPSDHLYWAYKAIWEHIDWQIYNDVYPQAKYIHLIRDPRTNIKSMWDFIGEQGRKAHWTLDYCSNKYVDSNRKALQLEHSEVPYIRVRQEDFIDKPKSTWVKIFTFLDLDEVDIDYELEVNVSETTRGKVKEKREDSAYEWSELSEEVIDMANELGYV